MEQPVMRINLEATDLNIRFFVFAYDYVYEKRKLSGRKLEAEPTPEAAATLQLPAKFGGGADDAVFLTLEDAGEEEGGSRTAVRLQPGKKVKEKVVVEVSDDQVGGWDGLAEDIPLPKTDACSDPVQTQIPLGLRNGHGIIIPALDFGAGPGGGEGEYAGATTEIEHPAGF